MPDQEGRTEQASEQKLQHAWDEGQVAVGHDAALVAAMAAGTLALLSFGATFRSGLLRLFIETARNLAHTPFASLPGLIAGPALIVIAVAASAGGAAFVGTMAQTRGGFWPHLALPDLTRLAQGQRIGRLFTLEFLVDLGLATVKVVALGWAAWSAVRDEFMTLGKMVGVLPADQLTRTFGLLAHAGLKMLGVAGFLAGLDFALTRHRFNVRMRMTKEESKREFKEDEGDPLIRSRRRRRHRDIVKGRVALEVPRADALIVNPTHVAVAVRYRRDEGRAPRVTAKGKGVLAEHMRELARSHGVPIVQDIPLARLLYRKVKVGNEIPAQTYRAVAAILAFVYRITGRTPAAGANA